MMGDNFECSTCEWGFASGWNHHASGIATFCSTCGEIMLIHGPNVWGPEPGVPHELWRYPKGDTEDMLKTGIQLTPFENAVDELVIGSFFDLSTVSCPACGGHLAFRPEELMPCPACKAGRIKKTGTCIY